MSTIRSQALGRLMSALAGSPLPSGVPQVIDTPGISVIESTLPSLALFVDNDTIEQVKASGGGTGPIFKRHLLVRLEVRQKAVVGSSARDQAEPILAWISKAIGTVDVANPSRVAHTIHEGDTKWETVSESDTPVCLATVDVHLDYQHRVGDAEQWA